MEPKTWYYTVYYECSNGETYKHHDESELNLVEYQDTLITQMSDWIKVGDAYINKNHVVRWQVCIGPGCM